MTDKQETKAVKVKKSNPRWKLLDSDENIVLQKGDLKYEWRECDVFNIHAGGDTINVRTYNGDVDSLPYSKSLANLLKENYSLVYTDQEAE